MNARQVTGPAVPITERERSYARTHTRLKIAGAIWALYDRLRSEREIDQVWLRTRLGKDKGYVSRLLSSPGNWTLDTVADLLEALEARIVDVEVHQRDDIDVATKQVGTWRGRTGRNPVDVLETTEDPDDDVRSVPVQTSRPSWSQVQDVLEDG